MTPPHQKRSLDPNTHDWPAVPTERQVTEEGTILESLVCQHQGCGARLVTAFHPTDTEVVYSFHGYERNPKSKKGFRPFQSKVRFNPDLTYTLV